MNAHEGGPTPARIAIMDKMANYCFNLNGEVTNRAKLIEMHRTHNTDKAESNRDKIQNGLLPDALTTDSGSHGTAGNPYQVVRELLRNAKFEENWGDRSYNNIAVHNGSVISIYESTRPNSPMGIAFAIVVNGRSVVTLLEDGTVADDHLKFTEFSLDELIEIIRQGLSDNSTAQTIERMKQAEQRQKDEIYKTWKESEEYAQRKQQLLKMIAKNNVIPGIAKDKVNMRLFLDVISVAVQIVDNDPEVVIPDLEWLQHHKSRYGSLWMINQSYSDENAEKKLGARKKLWSGIGAIAQSSEQEQRETFLNEDGYAKFGGNSIEFVENYAELRLPIQGDAVRFCLYQSRYSNETKTDKLFKIYEKLLEREIPVSLTFDDNAFKRSYLRLRNDDPEIAEIAQNADKPVVAPLEPIGYTSPVDAFVDIILGRNLEQRRDLRQQIIEKRGTDNIVRGNIRKELDVISTQLGVEKISLDELRNALVKEAKKNTLAGGILCRDRYFHALRCVRYDESIQSYTQYLIHGDEHLEIRRGLLEALRNSVAAMPQKGVTAFQTMWASPNPPIRRVSRLGAAIYELA